MIRLSGVIPALPVPRDARGRIHRGAHDTYARYMAGQPISGVAVWAHTGRGLRMPRAERREVLAHWRSALPGRLVVAGVGGPAMAEEALAGGADALLVHPPTRLKGRPREILAYHRALSRLGAPLVLFHLYEAAGGIPYPPRLLEELCGLPSVAGIKMATLDSVMTYQDVSALLASRCPRTALVTGEDRFLGYSISRGARCALVGIAAARTRLACELMASRRGPASRFLALSRRMDRFAEATFIAPMEGYILRMLWALHLEGVIPLQAAHDPWGPRLPRGEFPALRRACRGIFGP